MKHLLTTAAFLLTASAAMAQASPTESTLKGLGILETPTSQMEHLDRGLVAVQAGSKKFVSWRLLGTDNPNTTFDLYVDGELKAEDLKVTNYSFSSFLTQTPDIQVVAKVNGVEVDRSKQVKAWKDGYYALPLDRPAGGTNASGAYSYRPNDCSVGDVDGDGEYEIILKWDPTNSKDNSQSGYTGKVYIDCYKLDGTKLWRIDLGDNIRAGAHYTQFMVYDFDGDGKAEMICKTAQGSRDASKQYVNKVATDEALLAAANGNKYANASGWIDGGYEMLTVFNGETGVAIHTIPYMPNRNAKFTVSKDEGTFNWYGSSSKTDNHGYNRGERYLATVAYLDGPDENPSAVMCRGYYTYAYLWAVDFDGEHLKTRWVSASESGSSYKVLDSDLKVVSSKTYSSNTCGITNHYTMYGNGNHNLSCADVDVDGCDEIIWGSAAVDHDGQLLYSVGYGHGDAMHMSDLVPTNPGLEVFQVHEEGSHYGWDIHDARTGQIIHSSAGTADNGRGVSADIAESRGFEFWSAKGNSTPYSCITAKEIWSTAKPSQNFRIYWDGDLYDELLDNVSITKFDPKNGTKTELAIYEGSSAKKISALGSPASCNSTKATPCLSADILGDWREEVILWNSADSCHLNIYTTAHPTTYALPTLMHDHVYRLGVAWQNVAYNQPPHLGFSPIEYMANKEEYERTGIMPMKAVNPSAQDDAYHTLQGTTLPALPTVPGIYIRNGKKVVIK